MVYHTEADKGQVAHGEEMQEKLLLLHGLAALQGGPCVELARVRTVSASASL